MYFTSAKRAFVSNIRSKNETITNPYYGMNISAGREPLDQLDFIFLAKKLGIPITVLVAGKYGILNGKDPAVLLRKEQEKEELLKRIFQFLGVDGRVLITDAVWGNPVYWKSVLELCKIDGIIEVSIGPTIGEIPRERFAVPSPALGDFESVMQQLGMLSASGLYTLLEVTEALCLQRILGIDTKFGPESEERYDKFIESFMAILQFYQPLDLKSTVASANSVIPYMERRDESRIFLSDNKTELITKVCATAQRAIKTPIFWKSGEMPSKKRRKKFRRTSPRQTPGIFRFPSGGF